MNQTRESIDSYCGSPDVDAADCLVLPKLNFFWGSRTAAERVVFQKEIRDARRCIQFGYVFRTDMGLMLGDGFERKALSEELGYLFTVELCDDKKWTIPAIQSWMVRNRLGRRNHGATFTAYYRGINYWLSVIRRGGDQSEKRVKWAERLAVEYGVEYGVDARTIPNNAALARKVLTLATMAREAFCAREFKISGEDVNELAKLLPTEQESVIRLLRSGDVSKMNQAIEELNRPCQRKVGVMSTQNSIGSGTSQYSDEARNEKPSSEGQKQRNVNLACEADVLREADATDLLREFVVELFEEHPRAEGAESIAAALESVTFMWCYENGFYREDQFNA